MLHMQYWRLPKESKNLCPCLPYWKVQNKGPWVRAQWLNRAETLWLILAMHWTESKVRSSLQYIYIYRYTYGNKLTLVYVFDDDQ